MWWRRVKLDTELCLVESSVLVAFFFIIHISHEGFRQVFLMESETN